MGSVSILYRGLNTIILRMKEFHKCTFQYSKNCTSENIFYVDKRMYIYVYELKGYTLQDKALTSLQNYKKIYLRLQVKRFQMLCHVHRRLNLKIILCTLCLKGQRLYVKPGFSFNIFSGNLYFDALNLDLFQISLIISQSWRRLALKSACWLSRERQRVSQGKQLFPIFLFYPIEISVLDKS